MSIVGSLEGDARGRVAIRPHATLDGAQNVDAILDLLTRPTLVALRADRRFSGVELVSMGGADTEAAASARRSGFQTFVDIGLEREGARLVTTIAVFGAGAAERAAPTRLVHVPDVAMLRQLGLPSPVTESMVHARALRLPDRDYLAIGVFDLDRDGTGEIVGVRDGGVDVMRWDDSEGAVRVTVVGQRAWPRSARAPSRRRRPVALLAPLEDGVLAQLSDYSTPFRVSLRDGAVIAESAASLCGAEAYVLEGRCGRLVDGRDFYDRNLQEANEVVDVGTNFYALRHVRYETREGNIAEFRAVVSSGGRLTVRVQRTLFAEDGREPEHREHARSAPGFGTALAMTDMDLDGSAELLTSAAIPEGQGDYLRMVRAFDRGALRAFWRSERLEGSVFVACAGDLDGDGLSEFLAVEELETVRSRLWLVR